MTVFVWTDIVTTGWNYAIEKLQIYNKYATIYFNWICFMKKDDWNSWELSAGHLYLHFARFILSLDRLEENITSKWYSEQYH